MPRLTKATFQKHLNQLEKEDLVAELLRLFSKFKSVNEHFQMEYGEDTREVVNAYKTRIRKAFFPGKRIRRPKTAASKKAIVEFKKVALFDYDVVDLLLYRVENSIAFANEHNYLTDAFYNSIRTGFKDALQLIAKNNLHDEFKERCEKIIWFAGHTESGLDFTLQEMYKE